MTHELQIIARPQAGGLERILRTLRVRGFDVQRLQADFDVARGRFQLGVWVAGDRALEVLERQLARLVEVETVLAVHRGGRSEAAGTPSS
jgi:acetolactate synthase II small subunit